MYFISVLRFCRPLEARPYTKRVARWQRFDRRGSIAPFAIQCNPLIRRSIFRHEIAGRERPQLTIPFHIALHQCEKLCSLRVWDVRPEIRKLIRLLGACRRWRLQQITGLCRRTCVRTKAPSSCGGRCQVESGVYGVGARRRKAFDRPEICQ